MKIMNIVNGQISQNEQEMVTFEAAIRRIESQNGQEKYRGFIANVNLRKPKRFEEE